MLHESPASVGLIPPWIFPPALPEAFRWWALEVNHSHEPGHLGTCLFLPPPQEACLAA